MYERDEDCQRCQQDGEKLERHSQWWFERVSEMELLAK